MFALTAVQDFGWDLLGGAVDGGVLAIDCHGQDAVGLVVGSDFGVGEQADQAALEGSAAAFDLAPWLVGSPYTRVRRVWLGSNWGRRRL